MSSHTDKTNRAILQCLKENARMSWQQIGAQVHLSGQAVAARVQQMLEADLISGFTIRQDNIPLHFVTMFMQSGDFVGFEAFLKSRAEVQSAYKVTGEACYQIIVSACSNAELEAFLEQLLPFGKYKTASSLRQVV